MTNTRLLFSFLRLLQIHPDVMLSHPHNIHRRQLLVIIWNSVVNVELNVYEIYVYECILNITQCDVRLNVLDGRATVGGTSLLFKSSKYFPTRFSRFVEILAHLHSYKNSSLRANSMCIILCGGHDDYGNPWLSFLSQYSFVVLSRIGFSYLDERAQTIDQNKYFKVCFC